MWVHDKYRAMVIETLDDLIGEFNSDNESPNIDTERIYLTGFSQGGWFAIKLSGIEESNGT